MKNKMIITSIIYGMISCTHVTFHMDNDSDKLTRRTSSALQSPRRTSQPLVFYYKSDDGSFIPVNTANSVKITPDKNHILHQGYVRKIENDFEIFRHSTNFDRVLTYRKITLEEKTAIAKLTEENKEIYIRPPSNANTLLKLNAKSFESLQKES